VHFDWSEAEFKRLSPDASITVDAWNSVPFSFLAISPSVFERDPFRKKEGNVRPTHTL
jgi:hypothetical protein